MNKYAVIKRFYDYGSESNKYELVGADESFSSASDKAHAYVGSPGEILIICDMNDVSDLIKKFTMMFIVGHDGKPLEVPSVEHITGRQSPNWISLWEEESISPERAFWIAFDCGIKSSKLIDITGECVCAAVLKSRGRINLEYYVDAWKNNKINEDNDYEYVAKLIKIESEMISNGSRNCFDAICT